MCTPGYFTKPLASYSVVGSMRWLAFALFICGGSAFNSMIVVENTVASELIVPPNLTGCYAFGASNGLPPAPECGVAPVQHKKKFDLLYIDHKPNGIVDACFHQICSRPAHGVLITAPDGNVSMLELSTPPGLGNCTSANLGPRFPADGLVDILHFGIPPGWPNPTQATHGTNTFAGDLSGVFINNGNSDGGTAGWAVMNKHVQQDACNVMRELPYCTAFPPATRNEKVSSGIKQHQSYTRKHPVALVCGPNFSYLSIHLSQPLPLSKLPKLQSLFLPAQHAYDA